MGQFKAHQLKFIRTDELWTTIDNQQVIPLVVNTIRWGGTKTPLKCQALSHGLRARQQHRKDGGIHQHT